MNRTDRLYAIREELRRADGRGRTATELAERFETSTRTIKRDISALQQAGLPVWATPGPGGGYVVDASATLPPVNFTTAEATAVAVALSVHSAGPYAVAGREALAKIMDSLGPEQRDAVHALAGRIWIRESHAEPNKTVKQIEQGVTDSLVVTIDYLDAQGAISRRQIEPHLLARTRGTWYAVAWCRLRNAPRWFRLDRIMSARLTRQTFVAHPAEVFGQPPQDATPTRTD